MKKKLQENEEKTSTKEKSVVWVCVGGGGTYYLKTDIKFKENM
jgi:hypothetical protein